MSQVFGGLSRRVFVAAALCAAITALLVIAVIVSVLVSQFLARVAFMVPQLDSHLRQQCESDPVTFYKQHPIGAEISIDYYDAATLKPAVASMKPVDPVLLARLRAGEAVPARLYFSRLKSQERGGAALLRVADSGPCSLQQVRWRVASTERNRVWLLIFGLPTACIVLAILATSFLAVRPMTLRLGRLRRATQQIGQDSGYASAADPEVDDLGQLSLLLDQAHARIAADAKSAAERQKALEQHLANVAHDLRTPLASLQLTISGSPNPRSLRSSGLAIPPKRQRASWFATPLTM